MDVLRHGCSRGHCFGGQEEGPSEAAPLLKVPPGVVSLGLCGVSVICPRERAVGGKPWLTENVTPGAAGPGEDLHSNAAVQLLLNTCGFHAIRKRTVVGPYPSYVRDRLCSKCSQPPT